MSAALVTRARVELDYHGPGMTLRGEVGCAVLGPVRLYHARTDRGAPAAQRLVRVHVDGEREPRDIAVERFVWGAPEATPAMVPVEAAPPAAVSEKLEQAGRASSHKKPRSRGGNRAYEAGDRFGVYVVVRDTGKRVGWNRRAVYVVRCARCGARSRKNSAGLGRARRLGTTRCQTCLNMNDAAVEVFGRRKR